MTTALERLLEGAGEPLGEAVADAAALEALGDRGRELADLLGARNGLYAFASALHVFPLGPPRSNHDVEAWNREELWRFEYQDLADGHFFFAEDAFGNQFSVFDGRVVLVDAETARTEDIAADIPGWVERIVADHRYLTGWPLALEWQEANRPLEPGERLLPKKPFVIGGEYAVENLNAVDAVQAMQFRGYVAVQLRDLPDGATVDLRIGPAA